jgi:hypothetical protein
MNNQDPTDIALTAPGLCVPVLMSASAVALSARCGQVTAHDVDAMREQTEELLRPDDPTRPAIMAFASMYELVRRDPEALKALGEDLWRAVNYAVAPAPNPHWRADIDG